MNLRSAAWAGARLACVRPSHGAQPSSLIDADARRPEPPVWSDEPGPALRTTPYRRGNAAFVRHCNRLATADRIAPRLFDAFSTIHFREVLMFRMQSAFPNVVPRLG
ncbi:hypothetical protein [Burkholderia ubonensis]|uniref:hypothetical protein n=1 Tax=Burkholderia ubonensis TaxID=101571 RepID=UPI0015C31AF2|nr:hypothetical protein [Burkholderia ubonensis]